MGRGVFHLRPHLDPLRVSVTSDLAPYPPSLQFQLPKLGAPHVSIQTEDLTPAHQKR